MPDVNFPAKVGKKWLLLVPLMMLLTEALAAPGDIIFQEAFNNNGDLNSSWSKVGGDAVDISNDTFSSSPNSVFLREQSSSITSKDSRIDTAVPAATLSYWVRRGDNSFSEAPDSGEDLFVEYLNNSGVWTTLASYPGSGTPGEIFTPVFNLPSDALYSNLRLRFRFLGGDETSGDYWHIDDIIVTETAVVVASPDHFSIGAAATAVSCETLDINIQLHDASHNLFNAPSDLSIALSTSTGKGTWSGSGVTDSTPGDGQAILLLPSGASGITIQFRYADLSGNSSEVVNLNLSAGTLSEDSTEDPDITVALSGLRFLNQTDGNTLIPSQVAGLTSSQSLFLQAIRSASEAGDVTAASCVGLYPVGVSVTLEMAGECRDPSTCQVGQIAINGGSVVVSDDNGAAGAANYSTISLTFDGDGKAPITINYSDVGLMQLHGRDSAEFLQGSSNTFVVRPHHFSVTTVDNGAAVANPGTTTTSAGGNGFMAAGLPFRVVLEARNAVDALTPNYGSESTPESVQVATVPTLIYPAGVAAVAGTLSNVGDFSFNGGGEFTNANLQWNEVGTIRIRPDVADGDYLGSGAGVYASQDSSDIGRFYPAAFSVSGNTTVGYACRGFAYLSEPGITIDYALQAINAAGVVVTNYDNSDRGYGSDPAHLGVVTYHAENADNGVDLGARFDVGVTQTWDDGVYQLSSSQASFARAALIDGPFNSLQLSLTVSDADGASLEASALNQDPTNSGVATSAAIGYDGVVFSPLLLRYGRAILESASGPETAALPVTFGLQFWNGSGFVDAVTDSCSTLAFADITFATHNPIVDPQAVTVGGGVSNGSINSSGAAALVSSGSFGLSFSAPNDVGEFPVLVDLANYPWWRFDWNQDGDNDNDMNLPQAIISFGSYRGHDRVIFWRERF